MARTTTFVAVGSDGLGELVERGCDAQPVSECVDAEFLVPASEVLDERMSADDDARRSVGLQAAHWSQPGFQPCMVGLDTVVRIDGRVVLDVAQLVLDGTDQRLRLVGRHLLRTSMLSEDALEGPI